MTTTKEPKIGTLQTDSDGSRVYVGDGVNGDGWLWLHGDTARRLSALLQRPPWRPMSECPVPSEAAPLPVRLRGHIWLARCPEDLLVETTLECATHGYPLPEVTK